MSATGRLSARAVLLACAAAAAAACFWISNGVAPWDGERSNVWHHYEYLAEGFVHGHTYLSLEPDPELLRLKDPYDPATNARWRLWDASLYHGHFYLYQGPTPAVVLMAPWRLATGRALPQRLAVAAFAAAGVAALALLLGGIRTRHFPELSPLALGAILLVAFHASWLPVTLRRSGLWDLPVVAAATCLWWALYFSWKFHDSGGRRRWAVGAGAALALLLGSRVAYLFATAGILALLFAPAAGSPGERLRWFKAALPAALLTAAGGVALLLYNRARFGSWTEFGLNYTLFGEDYRGLRFSDPSFIPFNAATYLFSLPRPGPYFPFLHPFWSEDLPHGYIGFEEMYGILFMMPVHLAGLWALVWARRQESAFATRRTLQAGTAGSVLVAAVLFAWAWACSRFIEEVVAGWTVVTAVGLMALFGVPGSRAVRRLAVVAAAWSIACVWLASAEFRGFMERTDPRTYAAAARVLDAPSDWVARAEGLGFGPVRITARIPPSANRAQTVLLASGRPQNVNRLLVRRTDPSHVILSLAMNEHRVLETPPIAVTAGRISFDLAAPWLYPPRHHPFWDRMDPLRAADLQTLFSLAYGPAEVRVHANYSADSVSFSPAVQRRSDQDPDLPYVESLALLPARQ